MIPLALAELIGKLTPQRVDFSIGTTSDDLKADRETVDHVDNANVVSSGYTGDRRRHALLIDIDVPAWLVPSSTPDHSHLYADINAKWSDVLAFLEAAAKIGLVEAGYANACRERGYTSVRLPWVRKEVAAP